MAAQPNFLDTAIPIILIVIVIGFIWVKFKKPITQLYEWIKDTMRSKKHKQENPNTYSYVEYD